MDIILDDQESGSRCQCGGPLNYFRDMLVCWNCGYFEATNFGFEVHNIDMYVHSIRLIYSFSWN